MKNYKKILSFTLALVMALSVSAVSITVGAAGPAPLFSDDFGDAAQEQPAAGSEIIGNYNNWIARDVYTGSGTITTITENTIQKDGDNYVAQLKKKGHTSESNIKTQFIRQDVSIPTNAELAKVSFKMKRNDANARALTVMLIGDAGLKGLSLISDLYANNGANVGSRIMDWAGTVTAATMNTSGQQNFYNVGEWYDIDITLNKTTEKLSVSVNDKPVAFNEGKDTWSTFGITSMPSAVAFGMVYYGSGNTRSSVDYTQDASYQIDDVVVTGYTADDIAAMAGQEVDAALAKLSDVTAIKTAENLTLPTAANLGTTATVTWSSSNTAVLANDGTVTQAATEQTVKLTATVSSGNVTKTKVFDVTVLPENVYFYEGFNSVTTHSNDKLEGYNSWAGSTPFEGYTIDSVFTAQKDDNDNYYGNLLREKSLNTDEYKSRQWPLNKVVAGKAADANGGQSVSFRLKRDDNSKQLHVDLVGGTSLVFMTHSNCITVGSSTYYYPEDIKNEWMNVELIYSNGGVVAYVNGAPLTDVNGVAMPAVKATWSTLTKIDIYPNRIAAAIDGNTPTTFKIDDICMKTLSADYVSCVSAGYSLFANTVVSDLDLTDDVNGTTITLNSSDTSVVANDGKVTRPVTDEPTPVTLTFTITKNTESITRVYNVDVAPIYLAKITDAKVDASSKLDVIELTNFTALENAVAFAAVYTKNSAGAYVLKGVQQADETENIKAKGSQEIGFTVNNLEVAEGDVIKVFLWSDTNTLTPVAKAFSLEYSAAVAE